MKYISTHKIKELICLGALCTLVACDDTNPSSPEPEVSSSVELSSSSDTSEVEDTTEVVDTTASFPVELMTLENSIYTHDVYVSLENNSEVGIANLQWDVNVGMSEVVFNTALVGGAILVDKDYAEVGVDDLPATEEGWGATVVGESLESSFNAKTYIVRYPGAYDHATQAYGEDSYLKFKITYDHTSHAVAVVASELDGSAEVSIDGMGTVLLSTGTSASLNVPESYDIVLGGYKTTLESGTEYSVRGVLTNPSLGIEVAVDSSNAWADVVDSEGLVFSNQVDAIGHTWKTYSDGAYTITEDRIYLLKYEDGSLLKIKFLNFYNDQDEKGYPQFQYQWMSH